MLFTSPLFFVFVGIFFILLRWSGVNRITLINIFSCIFYGAWNPWFLILLFATTYIDYFVAIKMEDVDKQKRKKLVLISIISNLGLLSFFKYSNLALTAINDFFGIMAWNYEVPYMNIVLPVGISFYTFQTMSYAIDVYRGDMAPEKRFSYFFAYVSFFPQLIAGPIERADALIPQLDKLQNNKAFCFVNIKDGFELLLRGYFKKVVFADNFALYVDTIFSDISNYNTRTIIWGTMFFCFQIYADFSGYTDIARGLGRIMGIELSKNFNYPYIAHNISDFWRRWHITLSTWLRDYLYIPLGGNRFGTLKTYRNLFLTMVLGGLWHGASYNFILWGIYHGVALSIHRYWSELKILTIPLVVSRIMTFLTVLFSWFIFRVETIEDFFSVFKSKIDPKSLSPEPKLVCMLLFLIGIQVFEGVFLKQRFKVMSLNFYVRVVLLVIIGILFFMNQPPSDQSFIYFQF